MSYDVTIGLEIHVELSTKTKIFCSCINEFSGEPNSHCCPVCTGMPGALPVLNKSVIEYAIKTGIATNCEITNFNRFDRKNYFYPDSPKAYQISQLYLPICQNGCINIDVEGINKDITIREIHMEEDAGKLSHDYNGTMIDYNRCGTPLLEIVTNPDFNSSSDVIAFLEKLKSILEYIEVSDCKMQEGSLRADINLSIKKSGTEELGTRTETKNMNSFKAIVRAIEHETQRQIKIIESGGTIVQETRKWDDLNGTSFSMRSKEDAQDYRYYPEPDLPPLEIDEEFINRVKASLPELRHEKYARYINEFSLSEYDSNILTSSKKISDFFESVNLLYSNPKEVANWIIGDLFRLLKEKNQDPSDLIIEAKNMHKLLTLLDKKVITRNIAKEIFEVMFENNIDPENYVNENNLTIVSDVSGIEELIGKVLASNEKSVTDYKNGKEKALSFLIGQCMKELKGKADPSLIKELLIKNLSL